jgi:hypothetical protein
MKKTYLITPTLIQSWQYWFNYDGENEESVHSSFLNTLQRIKTQTTCAMQNGIDFEEKIMSIAESSILTDCEINLSPHNEIAKIVKGGLFQVPLKKQIDFDDFNILLYGRADVIKFDTVFDIKFTSKYELGKFSNSVQHLLYMFCSELEKFSYLISDGESYWKEDYFINSNNVRSQLISKINDFIIWIFNNEKYCNIFKEKWITSEN